LNYKRIGDEHEAGFAARPSSRERVAHWALEPKNSFALLRIVRGFVVDLLILS
jgi:hypothetical protein